MGVLDGQDVDAAVTNPAFINKNQNDSMPNILGLTNPYSLSIADIQAAVNKLYTASGASEAQSGTNYNATAGTITNGQNYQTALGELAGKFDPSTGHFHTGAPGDGPILSADAISNSPGFPLSVSGSNVAGTSGNFAWSNHQHQGVHSVASSGGAQLYSDVVFAPSGNMVISQSGQQILIALSNTASTPQPVGSTNVIGTGINFAIQNHAHQGIHSVAASGSSGLNGDVVFAGSGGIVVTQSGQQILITAPSGGSGTVTSVGLTAPAFMSVSGSPVTTSGNLGLVYSGTALPTANGGTNVTTPGASGNILTSDGTNWSSAAPVQPSLNYQSATTSLSPTSGQWKSGATHFTTPNISGSLWKISGWMLFNGNSGSVTITSAASQWSSADGTNTSTPPTGLTTTFGNNSSFLNISSGSAVYNASIAVPDIVVGPNVTVYLVGVCTWANSTINMVSQMIGIRIQ